MKNEQSNTTDKAKLQADIFALTQLTSVITVMGCAKESLKDVCQVNRQYDNINKAITAWSGAVGVFEKGTDIRLMGHDIVPKMTQERMLPLQMNVERALCDYFHLRYGDDLCGCVAWAETVRLSYESLTKNPVIHEVPWCLAANDPHLAEIQGDFRELQKVCEREWQPVCQFLCTPQEQREEGFYVPLNEAVVAYRNGILACYYEIGDAITKNFNL